MESTLFLNLSTDELYAIDAGWNWEYFTYGVAAVGIVGGIVFPPVAVVAGVYEATYWLTRAIVS